jgi:dTDP-4-dehydro-6-deoxy-alpha-D-glucopyranose 2,3-dehydratase
METVSEICDWLRGEFLRSGLQVMRIPFHRSRQWRWDERGYLSHHLNRFFSVVGVRFHSLAHGRFLSQPIIDQPEIGLLAFLVCNSGGKWSCLAHAKVEPGNVNGAQLAPTVQATRSNYEAVHGGSSTPYLEQVLNAERPLYDGLQSEQNSRFLGKRNRNKVVRLDERVPECDSRFKWMPIGSILRLLGQSHTVNTDARSVLACWLFTDVAAMNDCLPSESPFAAILTRSAISQTSLHGTHAIENWLDDLNSAHASHARVISLRELGHPWVCDESTIGAGDDTPLRIHHIDVSCAGREVTSWDQPIASSTLLARMVLVLGTFEGTLHLLVQAKLEAGNRDGFELTTTIQSEGQVDPWEEKYLTMAESGRQMLMFENSDEGGRFDHCIGQYEVVWAGQADRAQEGPFHRWVSLSQFSDLLKKENRITNELRSAASALLSIEAV